MNLQLEIYEKKDMQPIGLITYQTSNFFNYTCKHGTNVGSGRILFMLSDDILKVGSCNYVDFIENGNVFLIGCNYMMKIYNIIKDLTSVKRKLTEWSQNCSDLKKEKDSKTEQFFKIHIFNDEVLNPQRNRIKSTGYTLKEIFEV